MKIYTSYFASPMLKGNSSYEVIGITAKPPTWFNGVNLLTLAPSWDLVKWYKNKQKEGSVTEEDIKRYISIYLSMLRDRDDKIIDILLTLKNYDKDVVLVCYEKPDEFCHRHILASYIREKYGIDITELC